MQERIFSEREKAIEDSYFRQRDAALIDKLRQKADLDEIASALRDKLQVDNPELLKRVRELGITVETAPAFLLAPLVQVAWAEGHVTKQEHDAVLRLARGRGVEAGSPAYAQLEDWLKARPSDDLFDTAVEAIRYGFELLPPRERDEKIRDLVHACQEVAEASGGLGRLLGLGSGVSTSEASTLDTITRTLRSHG